MISMGSRSNLDSVDDAMDDDGSEDDQANADVDQLAPERIGQEDIRVPRVDEIDQEQHDKRQQTEHPSGHASLRGVGANLALDALPVAHDEGGAIENLHQIAARIPLYKDGGHHHPQVLRWDPI